MKTKSAFDPVFPVAALNTLRAPRWRVTMARLFGEKIVGRDFADCRTTTVTAYKWRGKLYFTDYTND